MFCGNEVPVISVVTGTLGRVELLKNMVESVRDAAHNFSYEIIVVDGGSMDGTQKWVARQKDIVLIEQGVRLGAVAAFNAGFARARGRFVSNLNDDLLVVGNVFDEAVAQLNRDKLIGQVAFPFCEKEVGKPRFDSVYPGKLHLPYRYANFGITRQWLGNKLGWWRNITKHYAGDPHLSMMIWNSGYRVDDLDGNGYVLHLLVEDSTRQSNTDSPIFYNHWKNWEIPPSKPTIFE